MFRVERVVAAIAGVLLLGGSSVSAQGNQASTTLNQFRPSPTVEDGFSLSRPDDLGHLRFGAQLHLDYANDPLVYEATLGDSSSEQLSVVEHQLTGTLGLSLGVLDRLVVYAGLPVNLVMDGDDTAAAPMGVTGPDGAGLGDIYLGARIRLFGEWNETVALALQITATIPSGGGIYRGDETLTLHPQLLFEARAAEKVRLTLNLGARLGEDQTLIGNVKVGDSFTFALGVTASLLGSYTRPDQTRLDLHAQIFGQTFFGDFFGGEETPLEALGGLKLHLGNGFVVGAAAGAGLHRSYGSPDARAILNLGWGQVREVEPEPEPTPLDTDGDGILDDTDQCPTEPEDMDAFEDEDGCPDPDNDQDQILDEPDQCPNEPEDRDGFEDEDGCPDTDNDQDGIPDESDECKDQPEDMDGFQDEDGCPEADNDEDGLVDSADRCPNEAGPPENQGCPDTDRDGDTVVDRLDNCPDEPGPPENQGCRERQRVRITAGALEILDKVYFATNRDVIQRRSFRLLDNVAAVLNNHPEIQHIRVEGHTDDRGDDAYNLDLSQRRAAAVVRYLVDRGEVDSGRLVAQGFGETRPIDDNGTRTGRAANRRVEFNIVQDGEAHGDTVPQEAPAENAE